MVSLPFKQSTIFIFVYFVCIWRGTHSTEHMWRSKGISQEMVLCFHHLGSLDQTQAIKLGNKQLYLLNHLTNPSLQVWGFCFCFLMCACTHACMYNYMWRAEDDFSIILRNTIRFLETEPLTGPEDSEPQGLICWPPQFQDYNNAWCLQVSGLLGDCTQVPVLARQTHYQLSYPSSPLSSFDLPSLMSDGIERLFTCVFATRTSSAMKCLWLCVVFIAIPDEFS